MHSFGTIVVFHPAAIGDAMLATPVATTLKLNFPSAHLTYWSHPVLRPLLLGLCPAIDDFVDYNRTHNIFQMAKQYDQLRPDLFVDLSNSTRGKTMTMFSRAKILRYEKEGSHVRPIQHATTNFLDTIAPICPELPQPLFPTIFPDALAIEVVQRVLAENGFGPQPLIAIVPGVGKHRPHRAWLLDGWVYLIDHILAQEKYVPVLIGGAEEEELCAHLASEVQGRTLNLAGKLNLSETAAVLKRSRAALSGDTGPAHLAVAVGTKVIGLYGPTHVERSGPYGCQLSCVSQTRSCRCVGLKYCQYAPADGPGECMHRIMLPEILERLDHILNSPSPMV
jgi:heptosyltransferase-1